MKSWALAARAAAMTSSVRGVGPAVADVLRDGAGEEDAVLHDDADLAPDRLDVVGGDGAGRR